MLVSPAVLMLKHIYPNVMVFGSGTVGGSLGHEDGALMNEILKRQESDDLGHGHVRSLKQWGFL